MGDDEETVDTSTVSTGYQAQRNKKKKYKKKIPTYKKKKLMSPNRKNKYETKFKKKENLQSSKKKNFFNLKKLTDKDISKSASGPSAKLDSNIYSEKAIEIIKSTSKAQPFFIYLALFTKSYPRQVKKLRGKKVENHRVNKLREMDRSMENILTALKQSGHYDNTVILFISDNGGRELANLNDKENPNYPLRGSKGTVYEGEISNILSIIDKVN